MSKEENKHEGMIMVTIDVDNKRHWIPDRKEFLDEEERLLIAKRKIEFVLKAYNVKLCQLDDTYDVVQGTHNTDDIVIGIKENIQKYIEIDYGWNK